MSNETDVYRRVVRFNVKMLRKCRLATSFNAMVCPSSMPEHREQLEQLEQLESGVRAAWSLYRQAQRRGEP